jgi:hypothetical protein
MVSHNNSTAAKELYGQLPPEIGWDGEISPLGSLGDVIRVNPDKDEAAAIELERLDPDAKVVESVDPMANRFYSIAMEEGCTPKAVGAEIAGTAVFAGLKNGVEAPTGWESATKYELATNTSYRYAVIANRVYVEEIASGKIYDASAQIREMIPEGSGGGTGPGMGTMSVGDGETSIFAAANELDRRLAEASASGKLDDAKDIVDIAEGLNGDGFDLNDVQVTILIATVSPTYSSNLEPAEQGDLVEELADRGVGDQK